MRRLPLLAMMLTGVGCSQSQPPQPSLASIKRVVSVAQQFAIKRGMASDCHAPGPHEHYNYKSVADAWIVDIVPPPGRGQLVRLTIRKEDFKVIRAQKIA
jgi:hypothetical protein